MRKRDVMWEDTNLTFVRVRGGMNIVPTKEGIATAREYMASREDPSLPVRLRAGGQSPDAQLYDMLECALGNGLQDVRPEHIGALTDAPIISRDGFIGDDGKWYANPLAKRAVVYAHMNYAIEDPVDTWSLGGTVFFRGSTLVRPRAYRMKAQEMWVAGR